MIDPLLDLEKSAKALDRSISGLRKMIADRRIEAVKDGGRWKIRESVINEYVSRNTYMSIKKEAA